RPHRPRSKLRRPVSHRAFLFEIDPQMPGPGWIASNNFHFSAIRACRIPDLGVHDVTLNAFDALEPELAIQGPSPLAAREGVRGWSSQADAPLADIGTGASRCLARRHSRRTALPAR